MSKTEHTTEAPREPQAGPAVVAPVDQGVRPAAWVRDLGPQPHCVTDLRYCAAGDVERGVHLQYLPLYDRAALDAAAAAEREQVAKWVDAKLGVGSVLAAAISAGQHWEP